MSEPLLVAEDLVAGYLPNVDILNGMGLTLDQSELVGIIGPNGAGKSTFLKSLFGLVPVRSGAVRLRGEDITGRPAHELVRAGVGYVPQRENVFPSLTIDENLRVGLFQRPKEFEERAAVVREMFPLLADRANQRAGNLSGGERQMVAMARALMTDPSVVLLDEPSAGLSPAVQTFVFERVRAIADAGVSVIMVEQNARQCLTVCDRGYVLDHGTNAYSGAGTDLLDDPRVIELYLGTLGRDN